ncbi:MAG: sorbosone dehydrogenase family protein [Acidimicrobiia bacterium]
MRRRDKRAAGVAATMAGLAAIAVLVPVTEAQAQPSGIFPSAERVVNVGADRPPVTGDFDGDGRGDLIFYSGNPDADGIWYGRSDGNVDPAVLGAGFGYRPIVGDYNGDAVDDVFWYDLGKSAPGIVWYGRRSRGFSPALAPATPSDATAVVSDLNGDGADDLFFYNPTGEDSLFTSTGTSFVTETAYVAGDYDMVAGDFDANGAGDVVLYDPAVGDAILWWGSRTGRVGGVTFIGTGFQFRGGDLNGDGAADLLWYRQGEGSDAVLYGQRNRSFLGAPVDAGGDFTPFVGDFDGDRRDDVFFYQPDRAEDLIWFFRPRSIDGLDVSSAVSGTPTVLDLNGDGADDTLFHTPGSGFATWWFGGFRAGAGTPTLSVTPLVSGLDNVWEIAFAPEGAMLYTEKGGRLSVRLPDGTVRQLAADFGDLLVSSETGLMGLAVDPNFAANRRIYTCQGATGQIKVVAWTVDAGFTSATRVNDPLVGGLPISSGRHGGCRLRFDAGGALLIGTGDAAVGTNPQDLTSLGGKVLRVDAATGAPAAGNPFLGSGNANTRLVYTYGHRNVQGLAVRPGSGQVFSVEHGPDRDDEVNLLSAGANHGWNPVPGYNESVPMTASGATPARWSSGVPTVAPSGAAFLSGSSWRSYDGALAVATLKGSALRVQFYDAAGTFGGEVLPAQLNGTYGRLRAVAQGPDGSLYIGTGNDNGADVILRVTPA